MPESLLMMKTPFDIPADLDTPVSAEEQPVASETELVPLAEAEERVPGLVGSADHALEEEARSKRSELEVGGDRSVQVRRDVEGSFHRGEGYGIPPSFRRSGARARKNPPPVAQEVG